MTGRPMSLLPRLSSLPRNLRDPRGGLSLSRRSPAEAGEGRGEGRPAPFFLRRFVISFAAAFLALLAAPARAADTPTVLLVVGAAGESEFGTQFLQQAEQWQAACQAASAQVTTIGLSPTHPPPEVDDLTLLRQTLEGLPKEGPDAWLVLVGHGTFDGRDARFNLRGPDLSASNLVEWVQPFRRRLAIVNTASASAPFLKLLSGTNRIVVTATRSGNEVNYTRFGSRLAQAIHAPAADLDQDGQTSLLEAFLSASFQVAEFYKTEGRLATEHALIDDNGDGLGTPADWFRGLQATKRPRDGASLDGLRAHQVHLVRSAAENELSTEARTLRDRLELDIAGLRERKSSMPEATYYQELETLLLRLAGLYATTASP